MLLVLALLLFALNADLKAGAAAAISFYEGKTKRIVMTPAMS